MKFSIHTLSAFAAIGLLASCKQAPPQKDNKTEVIPVKVMNLEQEYSQNTITASGQFTTDDETILSFKNGGIINRIFVKEGDVVRAGQVLATLDKTEINALSQQADIGLKKAERDFERASRLFKDSVATLEQMQNARTALDIARQQYVGASYNRNTSEIRATQSGYVLKKFVTEGQVVGPGTPVLQTNGAAKGNWILKAGVSDQQWTAIKIGDNAAINTDALEGRTFKGKVIKKSEGIDPMTGTFMIQVLITEGDKSGLAAGLFGNVSIATANNTNVWLVPYDAVMDGDRGNGYVFVSNDGKTAQRKAIRINSIQNKHVVVDGGLDDVRYVITNGNAYLKDGAAITIVK